MKIEVVTDNRFGITQEVLTCISNHTLDLGALEVTAEHIYLDIPELTELNLEQIGNALLNISGTREIHRIDLLPDERRRLHLDAILSTLPDPVFAIDANGIVLSANAQATNPLGTNEEALIGQSIKDILQSESDLSLASIEHHHAVEVTLANQPYLLEHKLLQSAPGSDKKSDNDAHLVGSILILQAPKRLGGHMSKVQMRGVDGFDAIVGEAPEITQIKERAKRFASINAPLLIQGETGTGKELVARAIHQAGPWHSKAFLALNCAALPENLIESELFGYASGAFSGASRSGKPGLLELADGGTAFLDEIGEMSPYVQAKLLRFIQDGTFRRIGAKEELKVNVRIISATHRNLENMVQKGEFREDLMYRLNVLNLTLPPLRNRYQDIVPLAKLFIRRAALQINCPPPELTERAAQLLLQHPWPGNIRQLENTLFRVTALTLGKTIDRTELHQAGISVETPEINDGPDSWKTAMAAFEKDMLKKLYKQYPSTRKLAKRLKVSHTKIADKLRLYGIN